MAGQVSEVAADRVGGRWQGCVPSQRTSRRPSPTLVALRAAAPRRTRPLGQDTAVKPCLLARDYERLARRERKLKQHRPTGRGSSVLAPKSALRFYYAVAPRVRTRCGQKANEEGIHCHQGPAARRGPRRTAGGSILQYERHDPEGDPLRRSRTRCGPGSGRACGSLDVGSGPSGASLALLALGVAVAGLLVVGGLSALAGSKGRSNRKAEAVKVVVATPPFS